MIEIQINGKTCTCEPGEFLLKVATRNGIYIPTLCHHEGVGEQGCCRLCLVEVVERGRSRIVVSCVFPVEKPIEVYTDSERVRENRAVVLMLLKERAPESEEIARLCEEYQAIDGSRFKALDNEKCIMCGLCARACQSLGTGAIATVGRGTGKKVSTPYDEPSKDCVGCLSCARICPTGAIPYKQDEKERRIWDRSFTLVRCESCGEIIGTREELLLTAERGGKEPDTLCASCRQKQMADVLAHTYGLE